MQLRITSDDTKLKDYAEEFIQLCMKEYTDKIKSMKFRMTGMSKLLPQSLMMSFTKTDTGGIVVMPYTPPDIIQLRYAMRRLGFNVKDAKWQKTTAESLRGYLLSKDVKFESVVWEGAD